MRSGDGRVGSGRNEQVGAQRMALGSAGSAANGDVGGECLPPVGLDNEVRGDRLGRLEGRKGECERMEEWNK